MIVLFPFHRLKKTESWGDCVIAQDPVTCKKQNENLKLRYLNTSSAQVTVPYFVSMDIWVPSQSPFLCYLEHSQVGEV